MGHSRIAIISLTVCASAALIQRTDTMGETVTDPNVAGAYGGAAGDDYCGSCWIDSGPPWRHKAEPHSFGNPADATKGAGWHPTEWVEGGCSSNHPEDCEECICPAICQIDPTGTCLEDCIENECGGTQDQLALLEQIRSGEVDAYALAASRSTFEINEARNALQIIGCGGEVVFHAPLPPASR
jgi:hypothetical protein